MSLKMRYNFLHLFYWFAMCCTNGFIAVFLQYFNMTNTEIGIVTGGSCILTIFLSPFMSSLLSKIKGLTIKKALTISFITNIVIFLSMIILPIPNYGIMILYMIMYALGLSTVPFLTMIAMNYISQGQDVNFGLARGIGSAAWAVSALLFGKIVDFINPTVLVFGYSIFILLTLLVVYTLPEYEREETHQEKQGSVLEVVKKYKVFFMLLVGFCFMFAGATCIGTYLINIVKKLGGNTSLYGVCIFFMAFSELPFMTLAPKLMKKFDSVTLIVVASVAYVLRNFTICLAPNLIVVMIGMAFQGLSYGLFTGVITYYITYYLEAQDQLSAQTLLGIMTSGIGSTIGNILGGVLQDHFGLNTMFMFIYIVTVIGVVIIFIAKKQSIEKRPS